MTLRDDVRSMVAGRAGDVGVPEAPGSDLAELPAELVGTAIGHFADTAPIAVADQLAPIAMATGPVPFDPELDGIESIDDPLAAFGDVDADPALLDDTGEHDARDLDDPSDFDVDDSTVDASADFDSPATADGSDSADIDESFGSGSDALIAADPIGANAGEIAQALDAGDDAVPYVADDGPDPIDIISDEPVMEFDPVDLDRDDVDPMDDDFDLVD